MEAQAVISIQGTALHIDGLRMKSRYSEVLTAMMIKMTVIWDTNTM
jgi:hypothetical protein